MKLGIIGGSGFYHLPGLEISKVVDIETPFGSPSAAITLGHLGATDIVFLPRHGGGHIHPPSYLPYRANIYALKQLGVTHLLSINAVGSLRQELPPLTLVLPDQIIDRTVLRDRSFFDDGIVAHVGIADPFCSDFSHQIARASEKSGTSVARGGTYVCIEGPQFSTKAESNLYRSWGASVIGMTAMPEARLAREAELCYASLALVTDFDVWHGEEEPVTVELVQGRMHRNTEAAVEIVVALANAGLSERVCQCGNALDHAIITNPANISPEVRARLRVIAGRHLDEGRLA
jgi:5'-methylthioadenosine phosphorylase